MKRILTCAALIAAILLALVSCSGNGVPDGMMEVSSENEAFHLYVPKGWSSNSTGGTASAFYTSSDRSNVSMTCMIREEGLSTLDEYMSALGTSLAGVLPEYKAESEVTDAVLGGKAAKSIDYSGTLDKTTYKYRQVVTVYGDDFYILTYTSTAENFELHLEDLEEIISNVVFK